MSVAAREFRSLLTQLTADLDVKIGRLLRSMDRLDKREALAFITDYYPALALPYAAASGALSVQYYNEQPTTSEYSARAIDLIDTDRLAASGRWAILQSDPETALAGSARRAVMDQSRNTILDNLASEHGVPMTELAVPGTLWARYASANACGFCRMLATRGAVYRSAAAALSVSEISDGEIRELSDTYHDSCHCTAIPVRPGGSYDPPAYVEQWERDYIAATKTAGTRNEHGSLDPVAVSRQMEAIDRERRAAEEPPATAGGGGGGTPPGPPTPPPAASGTGGDDEGWTGHTRGYQHPHRQQVWTESERVERQRALDIVPDGEQLYQHEIETVERLQDLGEALEWIRRDAKTFRPTNDVLWLSNGSIEVDFKATGAKYSLISQLVRKAVEGGRAQNVVKDNFIVDIGPAVLTRKLRTQLGKYNQRNPLNTVAGLWVLTRGQLVEIPLE